MRKYIKHLSALLLIPLTHWYLRKDRRVTYDGLSILVKRGVFHPGLFSSTKLLIGYLKKQKLKGLRLLELGCGTGMISVWATRNAHAAVTATDISSLAVENVELNAKVNSANVRVFRSDLFDSVPPQTFDWVVINPPYYAKDAANESDYAWYCGKDFEYFKKLFTQLPTYTHTGSEVIMVLTKGCDIQAITSIASAADYKLVLVEEKFVLFDGKDFIFKISGRC